METSERNKISSIIRNTYKIKGVHLLFYITPYSEVKYITLYVNAEPVSLEIYHVHQ